MGKRKKTKPSGKRPNSNNKMADSRVETNRAEVVVPTSVNSNRSSSSSNLEKGKEVLEPLSPPVLVIWLLELLWDISSEEAPTCLEAVATSSMALPMPPMLPMDWKVLTGWSLMMAPLMAWTTLKSTRMPSKMPRTKPMRPLPTSWTKLSWPPKWWATQTLSILSKKVWMEEKTPWAITTRRRRTLPRVLLSEEPRELPLEQVRVPLRTRRPPKKKKKSRRRRVDGSETWDPPSLLLPRNKWPLHCSETILLRCLSGNWRKNLSLRRKTARSLMKTVRRIPKKKKKKNSRSPREHSLPEAVRKR